MKNQTTPIAVCMGQVTTPLTNLRAFCLCPRYDRCMTYSKIFAIREGDYMLAFHGFPCVAGGTIVAIERDDTGLYFQCSEGKHYLDRQVDAEGRCLGLTALP